MRHVPLKCLNRVRRLTNYINSYVHEVTIKHHDKLKFTVHEHSFIV